MRTYFLAQHPTFGTKNKRATLSHQEKSPYYWWWSYLRRNSDYIKCCEKSGKTKLAALYKDFGDVRSDDFHQWWSTNQHGAQLFGEKPSVVTLKELLSKEDWMDEWNREEVMVVAVPLTQSKRDIQRYFSALLKKRHKAERGRVKQPFKKSTALYPLSRNFTIASLRIALNVYDYYQGKIANGEKIKLWQVGVDLKLSLSSIPKEDDLAETISNKRNVLAATVKRYLNQAEKTIKNTGLGVFP